MAESAPLPSPGAWSPHPGGRLGRSGRGPVLAALEAALDIIPRRRCILSVVLPSHGFRRCLRSPRSSAVSG